MRCQGRPNGKCPDNRNDNTVHNTIGDLFLCHACEEFRWPSVGAAVKAAKNTSSRKNLKPNVTNTIITRKTGKMAQTMAQASQAVKDNADDVDLGAVPATTCSECMMSATEEQVSCDICEAVCHINCLAVPQKLRDSLQKLLPIIGWVCDNCRISARHNLHKLQSAVSNLTQEVAHLQMQINNLTPSIAASDGSTAGSNLKSTDVEPKNLLLQKWTKSC